MMSTLTLAQRRALAAEQNTPYGTIYLRCDGRKITLAMERTSPKKVTYAPMTYVDNVFLGKWCTRPAEHPEHKFMRRCERRVFPEPKVLDLEKRYGKRAVAKQYPDIRKTVVYYVPYWPSFLTALNHLCRACESVEVIGPEVG